MQAQAGAARLGDRNNGGIEEAHHLWEPKMVNSAVSNWYGCVGDDQTVANSGHMARTREVQRLAVGSTEVGLSGTEDRHCVPTPVLHNTADAKANCSVAGLLSLSFQLME